jgi:hypothetical protein
MCKLAMAVVLNSFPETRYAHHIWYLRCYYYHWVDTSNVGLLVPEGIIRPVVSVSALTWFIIYMLLKFTVLK